MQRGSLHARQGDDTYVKGRSLGAAFYLCAVAIPIRETVVLRRCDYCYYS